MKKGYLVGLALALGFGASAVLAQSIQVPQVTSIGPNDLFQDIVGGQPQAQSYYASSALLGNYSPTLGGNNPENLLIGGDSTTNLYQRGTTGSSVTTTLTYGGPDRWAYWSGTSTAMTVSRTTTAGDIPANGTFRSGFKMARTSGQTGVVQVCMAQMIESANAYALSGQTAEIDFHATAGANFSAANSQMTVVLITGTGADEALSTAAFNYNAGGGGSSLWTGQVNTAVNVTINTASNRYTVAIPAPAGTTEAAVALCFTPVGTAGTNDYVAMSGIQLTRNSALTTLAGTAGVALPANDTRAKTFARRSQQQETALQQRYFYRLTESAAVAPVAPCAAVDTTHTNCLVQVPVNMRIAPTIALANGFASPTTTSQATLGACTTLTAATTVASTVASLNSSSTARPPPSRPPAWHRSCIRMAAPEPFRSARNSDASCLAGTAAADVRRGIEKGGRRWRLPKGCEGIHRGGRTRQTSGAQEEADARNVSQGQVNGRLDQESRQAEPQGPFRRESRARG